MVTQVGSRAAGVRAATIDCGCATLATCGYLCHLPRCCSVNVNHGPARCRRIYGHSDVHASATPGAAAAGAGTAAGGASAAAAADAPPGNGREARPSTETCKAVFSALHGIGRDIADYEKVQDRPTLWPCVKECLPFGVVCAARWCCVCQVGLLCAQHATASCAPLNISKLCTLPSVHGMCLSSRRCQRPILVY